MLTVYLYVFTFLLNNTKFGTMKKKKKAETKMHVPNVYKQHRWGKM